MPGLPRSSHWQLPRPLGSTLLSVPRVIAKDTKDSRKAPPPPPRPAPASFLALHQPLSPSQQADPGPLSPTRPILIPRRTQSRLLKTTRSEACLPGPHEVGGRRGGPSARPSPRQALPSKSKRGKAISPGAEEAAAHKRYQVGRLGSILGFEGMHNVLAYT